MSSRWSPVATKGSGYVYKQNSYDGRKQQTWVAKVPSAKADAAPTKPAAEVRKVEAPREKKTEKKTETKTGKQQGEPQKAAEPPAKTQENPTTVRMPRPGKRIYNKTLLLRVRDEVQTPEESPMKALCVLPRKESGLRADAPEWLAGALEAMSYEANAWAFDYANWDGTEAPYWTMGDYNLDGAGDSCEKAMLTRSPGVSMCEAKTDIPEDSVGFSVQNSPAVLPSPTPVPTDPAAQKEQAREQIEYYFSQKNLSNDWYLRSLMDDEGWVSMASIIQFPRMNRLKVAPKEAAALVLNSQVVEVTWEEDPRVRLRDAEMRASFPHYDADAVVKASITWLPSDEMDAGSYFSMGAAMYNQGQDLTAAGWGYKPSKKQRRKQQKRQAQTQIQA